jgi:nicotinamide-nucleotide amidase
LRVFIVITGSEFVEGRKSEKNSQFIAKECFERGLDVVGIGIVGDDLYKIETFLRFALDKSDIVIVSGGLGPTSDDLTREAIQEAISVQFVYNEEWLKHLKEIFEKSGRELTNNIKKMAKIPFHSKPVKNPVGKALGFIKVLENTKAIAAVPGVPSEMKPMVVQILEDLGFKEKVRKTHTFRTFGIPESELTEILKDMDNISFSASPKGVDIFIYESEREFLENKINVIRERLGNVIYSENDEEMEEVVGKVLKKHKLTISTAESSTGGLVVARLINVPGASDYVMAGIVSYSNKAKINILGVKKETLEKYGAVSEEVAKQMVEGTRELNKTDLAVSDTGIAGPTGETPEKPLGLHYIGFTDGKKTDVHKVIFHGERNDVRLYISQYCLNLIRLYFQK